MKVITVTGAFLAGFIILAGLFPSSVNWGAHALGFLSPPLALLVAAALAASLVAATVRKVQAVQERALASLRRLSPRARVALRVAGLALLAVVLWQLRQRTFFLGDGYLVIRSLEAVLESGDVPASFPTAPLSAWIALQIARLLSVVHLPETAQSAWQVLSVISGVGAFPMIVLLGKELWPAPEDRRSGTLLLALAGTAQLFAGYVETYPAAMMALTGVVLLAVRAWKGKGSIIWAAAAFGLLVVMHLGMAILLPVLVACALRAARRDGILLPAGAVAAFGLVVALGLALCGYTPAMVWATLVRDGTNVLPLSGIDQWNDAYALFSLWHSVDLANLFLLLSPFSIVLVSSFLAGAVLPPRMRLPDSAFWLSLAGPALLWVGVNNFELGLSRDWDLAAPFGFVVLMAGAVAWSGMTPDPAHRSRGLLTMAMFTAVHTLAWIGVNASADASIRRFDTLLDFRLHSPRSVAIAFEEVGTYRRERHDLEGAAEAYARSVVLDSTNARRWVQLGSVVSVLGDTLATRMAYERAIALETNDPIAYGSIGLARFREGAPGDALRLLETASRYDSTDAQWPYLLGTVSMDGLRDTAAASGWLERAVALDPAFRDAAKRLRVCEEALSRTPNRGGGPR